MSQCNSINAGVTGSRDCRLQTSHAAALMTRCNGAMDVYGKHDVTYYAGRLK